MAWTLLPAAPALASPQPPHSTEPATSPTLRAERARAVFAAHCIECHGPGLKFPKSDFGYVNDLDHLAHSELIAPGSPDGSRLWQLLASGDMPPDEASSAPPSAEEKQAVRAWIEGLAPMDAPTPKADGPALAESPHVAEETTSEAATSQEKSRAKTPLPHRLRTLAGHAHVLAVHFPIAMLVAAGGLELLALARSKPMSPATRALVRIGALTALAAAVMGWLLAWDRPDISGSDLWIHRWLGTGAALAAALALAAMERTARAGLVPVRVRAGLVAIGIAVAIAAHFGGVLVHGPNWMRL